MSTGPFDPNSGYGVFTNQPGLVNNTWHDADWIRNRLEGEKKERVSVAHQLRRILQETVDIRDSYVREIIDGVDVLMRSDQLSMDKEQMAKRLFAIIAPHLDHAELSSYLMGNTDANLGG